MIRQSRGRIVPRDEKYKVGPLEYMAEPVWK